MHVRKIMFANLLWLVLLQALFPMLVHANDLGAASPPQGKQLAYIVSDLRIPFWSIMAMGVKNAAVAEGYGLTVLSNENDPRRELEAVATAIRERVDGIIISPTTSSACTTVLKLARKANIPVVIADIGTDGGEYVSYISSDNLHGAYQIGQILAAQMRERRFEKGRVGIIAIPQKRLNGQERTAGFMRALDESGIRVANIRQQVTFSDEETYRFSRELIAEYPDLRAIWLQGSDRYRAAQRAIADVGKMNQIFLVTFDAEPEFLTLIPKGILVGAAMQQPYLMGQEAVKALDAHRKGQQVARQKQLPVLAVSASNIAKLLPVIRRNVFGLKVAD